MEPKRVVRPPRRRRRQPGSDGPPRHRVLTVGLLAWALWEQSGSRPWEPRQTFEERVECIRALTKRVDLLETHSKRTTAPLVSEVHEVAASLGTLGNPRASVFLVCLPNGIDLRTQ
jgi:hypothetical protein